MCSFGILETDQTILCGKPEVQASNVKQVLICNHTNIQDWKFKQKLDCFRENNQITGGGIKRDR